jgi:cullin-4
MSMQLSESSSDDNIAVPTRHARPRTISSHPKRRTSSASTPTQQISNASVQTSTGRESAHSYPYSPASKRVKTSDPAEKLRRSPGIGKTAEMISRPKTADPSRPSHIMAHKGSRRLVIKNLKTTSEEDIDAYYESTWRDVDAALTSNFNREQPATPLEILCRGVEALCRRGRADQLSRHVRDCSKTYLEERLLPVIEIEVGPSNVDSLRAVHKFWMLWNEQSVRISTILARAQ